MPNFAKGDELGWFEHGSTIIVFAPEGFALCDDVREGATIRVGEPLMRLLDGRALLLQLAAFFCCAISASSICSRAHDRPGGR